MIEQMMRGIAMLLVCLCGLCPAEHAVFTKQAQAQSGLLALLGANQSRIEAHFFRAAETGLCIVDEGNGKPAYGSLETAMKKHRCVAGVNGGYFAANEARSPIGLVRHGGYTVSPLATAGSFTVVGVVYDTGETIRIERTARLQTPVRAMREGIQGGPFLVEHGRVVPGLESTRKAARTFIATDGAGRWCLAVSSPLSLHELALWLVEKGGMGDFRVQTALNLDGGSSCSFWDAAAGSYLPGFKAVRNYVGVRPRALNAAGGSADHTPPAR